MRKLPSLRSTVTPAKLPTFCRSPVRALKSVVFPVFGFPTRATRSGRAGVRPKVLTLAGVRSYRAEQRVDFSDAGLLAIVGETGAGKSSLLEALCVALHPGTVTSDLSQPFTRGRDADALFTPDQSAEYLLGVLDRLTPAGSGGLCAWDGAAIPF